VYDLAFQTERERLAATIAAEIEADSVAEYDEAFRSHLGASVIGDACERRIWNNFRWLKKKRSAGVCFACSSAGISKNRSSFIGCADRL
jgi:hypothetical protein